VKIQEPAGSSQQGAGSKAPACADAVAGELSIEIRQRWAEIHEGINPLHADREQFGRFLLYLTQLANGRLVILHRPTPQP
jgi:hypothetical protein